jgi:allophanate hydrolase subunit 2
VAFGALQVPSGGAPILLDGRPADRRRLSEDRHGHHADLLLGQLAPGEAVRFAACTRAEARSALIARERDLLRALPEGGTV